AAHRDLEGAGEARHGPPDGLAHRGVELIGHDAPHVVGLEHLGHRIRRPVDRAIHGSFTGQLMDRCTGRFTRPTIGAAHGPSQRPQPSAAQWMTALPWATRARMATELKVACARKFMPSRPVRYEMAARIMPKTARPASW